jgi:hypothetical protein
LTDGDERELVVNVKWVNEHSALNMWKLVQNRGWTASHKKSQASITTKLCTVYLQMRMLRLNRGGIAISSGVGKNLLQKDKVTSLLFHCPGLILFYFIY